MVPISTLIKDTTQRLNTFVAGAFAKETEICRLEKDTAKIMEKAEWNLATIETDIDSYVNKLVSISIYLVFGGHNTANLDIYLVALFQ